MGLALPDVVTGENRNDTPDRVLPPGGRCYSCRYGFTYARCCVGAVRLPCGSVFFNLPCFDPFINVIDPLAEPTHDIYTLTIAARLIARSIGAELRGLLTPGDPGVIVGESHKPLAFDGQQPADA